MDQVQRRFIRLSEVSEKTTLTQGDVLAAAENGMLPLCASIDADNFGALINSNGKPTLCAVFKYRGNVRLSTDMSQKLAVSGAPCTTKSVLILEPESVSRWRSVPDTFPHIEKSEFLYTKESVAQPSSRVFAAYSGLKTQPTLENVVGKFAQSVMGVLDKQKHADVQATFPNTPSQRLLVSGITIDYQQVRLDLKDIERVFGEAVVIHNKSALSSKESTVSKPPLPLTHPIAQIIYRVLIDVPSAKSIEIWNLLRRESSSDDDPTYDIDAIIDNITQESLLWVGQGGQVKSMSYGSFRKNILADVKRYLREQAPLS